MEEEGGGRGGGGSGDGIEVVRVDWEPRAINVLGKV